MPKKKAKDEIEVPFGFKQALALLVFAAVASGGVFLWGYETGHKRALRGEASLFAFLERSARLHEEPVEIPEVLMTPPGGSASGAAESARVRGKPAAPPSTTSKPTNVVDSGSATRVKPRPAVETAKKKPTATPSPAVAAPVAARPAPAPVAHAPAAPAPASAPRQPASKPVHFQVAALGVRGNAKALADWLRKEGFQTRIQPAASDGLFRVYVGPFSSNIAAANARARLAADGFKPMVRNF